MGTKNNPGKFDCYQNAEPDEPMFVLLGRDPSAAQLVRMWAYVRQAAENEEDLNKIKEALECADAMELWAQKLGKQERILEAESAIAWSLIRLHRSNVRAIQEGMIHKACDWVRAHGPHIPNAGQMQSDLFQMLDRDDGLIRHPSG